MSRARAVSEQMKEGDFPHLTLEQLQVGHPFFHPSVCPSKMFVSSCIARWVEMCSELAYLGLNPSSATYLQTPARTELSPSMGWQTAHTS